MPGRSCPRRVRWRAEARTMTLRDYAECLVSLRGGGPRQAGSDRRASRYSARPRSAGRLVRRRLWPAARRWYARDRSGFARRQRLGQEIIKHLRAGLRLVAESPSPPASRPCRRRAGARRTAADRRLSRTRPKWPRTRRLRCHCRRALLRGADGQQDQHEAEPERHSQQEEHDTRIPRGTHCRTWAQPSRQH